MVVWTRLGRLSELAKVLRLPISFVSHLPVRSLHRCDVLVGDRVSN